MREANEMAISTSPTIAARSPVRVGIVGYGTVGKATAEILTANAEEIALRIGVSVLVTRICRKTPHCGELGVNRLSLACNWQEVVLADDVDIVVEAVGGTDVALEVLRAALNNGKA